MKTNLDWNQYLEKATEVEKTRGMAQGKYIKPNFGDSKESVAKTVVNTLKDNKKVAFVVDIRGGHDHSYLFHTMEEMENFVRYVHTTV